MVDEEIKPMYIEFFRFEPWSKNHCRVKTKYCATIGV